MTKEEFKEKFKVGDVIELDESNFSEGSETEGLVSKKNVFEILKIHDKTVILEKLDDVGGMAYFNYGELDGCKLYQEPEPKKFEEFEIKIKDFRHMMANFKNQYKVVFDGFEQIKEKAKELGLKID
jgi:hypothetical protein